MNSFQEKVISLREQHEQLITKANEPEEFGNGIYIRYKNPIGIYRDFENDTDYEVESREDIIDILRKLDNE
jgi:hypothetical protein